MGKYIIELDDKYYELVKADKVPAFGLECRHILVAVMNSKPYKPVGDLISREALKKQLKELLNLAVRRVNDTPNNSPCYRMYVEQENERARLIDLIDNAPPIDAIVNTMEVRPRGEWIKTPELFRDRICSHCKQQIPYSKLGKFCVECGADMRGGATNELY